MIDRIKYGNYRNFSIVVISVVLLAATAIIAVSVAFVGAKSEVDSEELERKALAEAKEYNKDAVIAKKTDRNDNVVEEIIVKNGDDKDIAYMVLDRSNGEVLCYLDYTINPGNEILISLGEAQEIAEGYLGKKGVEISKIAAERAELYSIATIGDKDERMDFYQYEFTFRPLVDGLFVQNGDTWSVTISPKDGAIMAFMCSKDSMPGDKIKKSGNKISKDEAKNIASEKVSEEVERDRALKVRPSLKDSSIKEEYVAIDEELIPCWHFTFELSRELDSQESTSEIDPELLLMGEIEISINSLDGSIVEIVYSY